MSRERESRRERRARTREERRLTQQQRRGPLLTKSRALILAGLLALTGGAGYVATQGGKMLPTLASGEVQKSDEQIIQEEIQRLGIKESQKETDLWTGRGIAYSQPPRPIMKDEVTRLEAEMRVKKSMELMSQSENPYLREAANFLQSLSFSRRVFVVFTVFTPEMIPRGEMVGIGGVTPIITGGQLNWRLDLSAYEVINRLDSLTLAMKMVHEVEHIKNEYLYLQPFQILSPEEQLARLEERYKQERLVEEGRAYGKQSLTFIYQAGLHGVHPKGLDQELAAAFIRTGKGVDNLGWLDYIRYSGHVDFHNSPK